MFVGRGRAIIRQTPVFDRSVTLTASLRTWRHLDTVAGYLRDLGLARFEVDAAGFDAAAGQQRPVRAEALKRAQQAAEHDRWFRAQVGATVQGDDAHPDDVWLTSRRWPKSTPPWPRRSAKAKPPQCGQNRGHATVFYRAKTGDKMGDRPRFSVV
jgi:hypothetical protein